MGDWQEIYEPWPESQIGDQGARCMSCGVPFCHVGCPLGNLIPDFNHLVYTGQWAKALKILLSTNNFPEFTGRLCPAPCEASCTLAINTDPVTIESIEKAIVERGFEEGWIVPEPPETRTGKRVAVVGSGPAGLAAAQQLNRAGHLVTVFERADYIGGLLVLGIPEFKLEKRIVDRRVNLMRAEGIEFRTGVNIGLDLPIADLQRDYDAVLLSGGSTLARDLPIPGRELDGIYPAVTFLSQQNRIVAGEQIPEDEIISAKGKDVVVLGGGDTGSDCVGTSHRQGARSVHQFELLPEPPAERRPDNPWPYWPMTLRTSSSHDEGGVRDYNILTRRFGGSNGSVENLQAVRLDWGPPDETGRPAMIELPGSEFELETQLVLLALGFLSPERNGMLDDLGVELDPRGNVAVDANMMTSVEGVFAAGDMARGQSLIVWAIALGRDAARGIDEYLMDASLLPPSAATRTAITG